MKVVCVVMALIASVGWSLAIYGMVRANQDAVPFDHSQCQYPSRASNPVDGCDNSDPARPECMKLGEEDCHVDGAPTEMPSVPVQPEVTKAEPTLCK